MEIFKNAVIDFREEPLFFGEGRNIQRLDLGNEEYIEKMYRRHHSQIWFPHDVSLANDAKDYALMNKNQREFFLKNLKFQTLLDSLAGRGILETFIPVTTDPTLEVWWVVHGFFESTIHSPSYAEIIKALGIDATEVFDDIMVNDHILERGSFLIRAFDALHDVAKKSTREVGSQEDKQTLITALFALNILENIMFKTSFICSFAFAENKLMEGSSKIMSLISNDEILHYTMSVYLLNRLRTNPEYSEAFKAIESSIIDEYEAAYIADCKWVDYLYETDPSLIGISADVLKAYSRYNINKTLKSVGLLVGGSVGDNPCKWADKYMSRSGLQTALNETDGISYLFGIINKDMKDNEW
jgi:ribonucleoside-diphosphate reductase beta chain